MINWYLCIIWEQLHALFTCIYLWPNNARSADYSWHLLRVTLDAHFFSPLFYSHMKALNYSITMLFHLSVEGEIGRTYLEFKNKEEMYVFFPCNKVSNCCWRLNYIHLTNNGDAHFIKFQKVAAKYFKIKKLVHFFKCPLFKMSTTDVYGIFWKPLYSFRSTSSLAYTVEKEGDLVSIIMLFIWVR